jgi:hypothetical protein
MSQQAITTKALPEESKMDLLNERIVLRGRWVSQQVHVLNSTGIAHESRTRAT